MDDKKIIGAITVGLVSLLIFLSMTQTPDTSDAIYFVNYTSGNNTTYYGIDYILVNVSVNDTTIKNPSGIKIDIYYANGTLKESRTEGVWE